MWGAGGEPNASASEASGTGSKDERVHEPCCCRRCRNVMQLRRYNRRLVKLQLPDGAYIQTAGCKHGEMESCDRQRFLLEPVTCFVGIDRAMCYDGDAGAATVCWDREDE